jgi:hypothetical protein
MCRCGGANDHEHGLAPEVVQKRSLYPYVDFGGSTCLNVKKSSALPYCLREKFETDTEIICLESDADKQLLVKITYSIPVNYCLTTFF